MKKGLLSNKYTLSVIILLAILGVDIILHKGMSRVMLPKNFTDKRSPSDLKPTCSASILSASKTWSKAVNTLPAVSGVDSSNGGIEMDVYFDTAAKDFFVYHDSSRVSDISSESILSLVTKRSTKFSVWLDFKNLDENNAAASLEKLESIRSRFALGRRIIVESSNIEALQLFCEKNFYTSFYTPFFNPYKDEEKALLAHIDTIAALVSKYPVNALSGYYFQAPFLRKYFPNFPVLTWADQPSISLVANVFDRKLRADDHIPIVLYPTDN